MHFIFGLAVNHHFNEMEVAQFEHFYHEKMQNADIFSSEIVESTARNRYLSFAERLERLRDDDALGFTSDGKFLQFYWLGKRAMYLEIHSKIQDEYNCIEIIGIIVERVQKIFGNRMIAIYNQGTYPAAWILELVVEGMGVEDILNYFDEKCAIRLTKISRHEIGEMRGRMDCGLIEYSEYQA